MTPLAAGQSLLAVGLETFGLRAERRTNGVSPV